MRSFSFVQYTSNSTLFSLMSLGIGVLTQRLQPFLWKLLVKSTSGIAGATLNANKQIGRTFWYNNYGDYNY